jgi:hypothetical protein
MIQALGHGRIGGSAHTIYTSYTSPPIRPCPGERILMPSFSGGLMVWHPHLHTQTVMTRTRAVATSSAPPAPSSPRARQSCRTPATCSPASGIARLCAPGASRASAGNAVRPTRGDRSAIVCASTVLLAFFRSWRRGPRGPWCPKPRPLGSGRAPRDPHSHGKCFGAPHASPGVSRRSSCPQARAEAYTVVRRPPEAPGVRLWPT